MDTPHNTNELQSAHILEQMRAAAEGIYYYIEALIEMCRATYVKHLLACPRSGMQQGYLCSAGIYSGSSSSLFSAACPRTNLPATGIHITQRTTDEPKNPETACPKGRDGCQSRPRGCGARLSKVVCKANALWSCVAPADHRLVDFESQGDDWLWRERGIARSDDAGCCGIMERGLSMSKLCVSRWAEG